MEKFINQVSVPVPLCVDHIDTDRIIPARFLKATERKNFGDYLFYDLRYKNNGELNQQFILNSFSGEQRILLTGKNFGCGSSREHAAWAVFDYGFRVVISTRFADIFYNNALNIGLLPVVVTEKYYHHLKKKCDKKTGSQIVVDLEKQMIACEDLSENFTISSFHKMRLLNGYETIDYLKSFRNDVIQYEKNSKVLSFIK